MAKMSHNAVVVAAAAAAATYNNNNNNKDGGPESDCCVLGFSGFPQSHLRFCGKAVYLKSTTVASINILSHSLFTNIAVILQ
jgi:hypothetical protein